MSGRDDPRLPARTVDYIQDIVGADVPRDLIKVAVVAQDLGELDVSAAEVDVDINSQTLTPLTVTDNGSLSLSEYTGGNLPISLEAQNATPLTVTDDGSLNIAGVVTIQEDTPLDVSATTVPTDPDTSDSNSLDAATLAADGELTMALSAKGAERILGQVQSSGSFNVVVRWQNSSGTTIREETVKNNTSGGSWANIDQPAKSAEAIIAVVDTSSAEQTVNATVHSG